MYEWQLGPDQAWVRGANHFLGEHFVNVTNDPEFHNPYQHFIDLSVNCSFKNYTFSVYGRNLADEDGIAHGFDGSDLSSYGIPRAPHTWGLEVVYNFGE